MSDTGTEDQTSGGDDTGAGKDDPLTRLQAEFVRIGAQERGRGETAGKRDLLKKLDFPNTEEAVAAVTAWRAGGESATDTERRLQESETARAAAERKAGEVTLSFSVVQTLVAQGVRPDRVEHSLSLVLMDLAKLPESATADQVKETVTAFKTSLPEMFGGKQSDQEEQGSTTGSFTPRVPGPAGFNGGTAPAGARTTADPSQRGTEEFTRRFGKLMGNKS